MKQSTQSRTAIIGNMNNNGFSLLRYFIDAGADATLFCYSSDSSGNLAHFSTDADTWQPEKWRDRIRTLDFGNNIRSLYPRLFNPAAGRINAAIRDIDDNYDIVLGSGIAPALFARAGRRLTGFYPYATGVELLGHLPFLSAMRKSPLKRALYGYGQRLQTRGILEAGCCFNAEMSLTKSALDDIGRPFDRLAIPMVYNREEGPRDVPDHLQDIVRGMQKQDFVVFSHSRQLWVQSGDVSTEAFKSFTKNSDWLIRGFADFVASGAALYLVEYGPDVAASKALICELGLEDRVIWLPKMPRRDIVYLLGYADVGVGEFHADPGIIWGGTGWEILSAGVPLLQCFNFTTAGFEAEFGHPPPPILHAASAEEISAQLQEMWRAPDRRHEIGRLSQAWFDRNNGLGLARAWLARLQAHQCQTT